MDHHSRRVQGVQAFDSQPTGRQVRQFLASAIRKAQAKPRSLIVDKGRQFWSRGFKSWCRAKKITPRFGAVGKPGSIALVERLIRTLKMEFTAGQIIPGLHFQFQRELESFVTWYNAHRPHSALAGQTPNEVHFRHTPAHRKRRYEPRPAWPRGSPCAQPQARVKGKCGARFSLHVRLHAGHKQS